MRKLKITKPISVFLISLLLLVSGCNYKTTTKDNKTVTIATDTISNINFNNKNSSFYKESEACSTIILDRINKNEKLNDTEQKKINDYILKGDLILDQGTNNYDWLVIVSIKAANKYIGEYFDALENKEKYTAIAKATNKTYDEFVKFEKSLISTWCEKCFSVIKENVK